MIYVTVLSLREATRARGNVWRSPALAYNMAELLCPTNTEAKGCRRRAVAGCPSTTMAELIPQEVMVIIASCIKVSLTFEGNTFILKTKLLPLRCASKAWRAAVAVAVKDHNAPFLISRDVHVEMQNISVR